MTINRIEYDEAQELMLAVKEMVGIFEKANGLFSQAQVCLSKIDSYQYIVTDVLTETELADVAKTRAISNLFAQAMAG